MHGPQGGFHIVLALEATHLAADDTLTAVLTGTIQGEVRAESYPYVDFRCNHATDTQQVFNLLLIYDAQPEELDGQLTHVTAELTDGDGVAVSAEADVTIEDPTLD